jgi:starch synthase
MDNTRILFVSSEVVPFAKTGGLADVAGSLPKALKKLGQDVRIIMPKYSSISKEFADKMEYIGFTYVNVGWRHQYCGVFRIVLNEVTTYFLDNEYYFKRDGLYGHSDEAEQYTFFCKAVIEILPVIGFKPDIVHCNDWQTGMISLLLRAHYGHLNFYRNIKTVFTIHNLRYQGIFPKNIMEDMLGLSWEYFTPDGIEFYNCINFMKAGLTYSDIITTVSRTFVQTFRQSIRNRKRH